MAQQRAMLLTEAYEVMQFNIDCLLYEPQAFTPYEYVLHVLSYHYLEEFGPNDIIKQYVSCCLYNEMTESLLDNFGLIDPQWMQLTINEMDALLIDRYDLKSPVHYIRDSGIAMLTIAGFLRCMGIKGNVDPLNTMYRRILTFSTFYYNHYMKLRSGQYDKKDILYKECITDAQIAEFDNAMRRILNARSIEFNVNLD